MTECENQFLLPKVVSLLEASYWVTCLDTTEMSVFIGGYKSFGTNYKI